MIEFSIKTESFELLLKADRALVQRIKAATKNAWYRLRPLLWVTLYQICTNAPIQAFAAKVANALYQIINLSGLL